MSLRCVNPKGINIHSFDLSNDEWDQLKQENRKLYHLKMPCCDAKVILKQSRLETRFFAHKTTGTCISALETEEHHFLKHAVMIAARKNGWKANTEVTGNTPSGEEWRADVLALKGKHKVAIEIQWSGQTNEETITRQQRYKESGIRGLWLLRQPGFSITRELPAICIGGDLDKGFNALIPNHSNMTTHDRKLQENWSQVLSIDEFFNAVFDSRFKFGLPLNSEINIIIRTKKVWCPSCKEKPYVIFMLGLNYSDKVEHKVDLNFFYEHDIIIRKILRSIPDDFKIGINKVKHKKNYTLKDIENTCYFCGEFISTGNFNKSFHKYLKISSVSFKSSLEWQGLLDIYCGQYWRIIPHKLY